MADNPVPPGPVGLDSVHPTVQLAQALPGYDPAPYINAQEANLQDYLNTPVQEILGRLGINVPAGAPFPGDPFAPPGHEGQQDGSGGQGSPFDPSSLIQPLTDALGSLGTGLFEALDPSKVFEGISSSIQQAAGSLQQALSSLTGGFEGATGSAAGAKTAAAMTNGAEVGAQSLGLGASVATAAADTKQAEARLLEILHQWQAEMASLTPGLPWTAGNIMESSSRATAMSTEVMTELQSSLAAQAGEVMAIGAPVPVTAAPQMGAQLIGPMLQVATGMASPLMSIGTQAISTITGMATKAMSTGIETATSMAKGMGDATKGAADKSTAAATSAAAKHAVSSGAGGVPRGGGGGLGGSTATPAARTASMPLAAPSESSSGASTVRAAGVSSAGVASGGMMGGGMGGAAAGHKGGAEGSGHTAAQFLHGSSQGDELIGDLGSVAPPVIGEADPNEAPPDSPDIELRI